jgi:hypothetical protein
MNMVRTAFLIDFIEKIGPKKAASCEDAAQWED